jgi:broad specificity phosphatase PhoE
LRSLMKAPRGANWVLVSHGSTILALTGISPATGEMVIVAPSGALAGRLVP